jgi:hypothetical protein
VVPGALGRPRTRPAGSRTGTEGHPGSGAAAHAPAPEWPGWHGGVDRFALIEPPAYFRFLAGVEVPAAVAIISCPLPDHQDEHASCRVFPEAERGWWCYGCARGGRIYDLASLLASGLWGRQLRGEAFRGASDHVRAAFS